MTRIAVCSICSRVKNHDKALLPARLRYLGEHIKVVEEESRRQKASFFILSGVYGFISGEEPIEDYDSLLSFDEVPGLVTLVGRQLRRFGVTEVHFYCKNKKDWLPYQSLIRQAAAAQQITLVSHELKDD